jgi:hypothetical protein
MPYRPEGGGHFDELRLGHLREDGQGEHLFGRLFCHRERAAGGSPKSV